MIDRPHPSLHDRQSLDLPLSVMAQSSGLRVLAVCGVIVVLWLAVWWAVSLA